MAVNLSSYLVNTQRLLHDTNGSFYSQPQLTDYINEGRVKVAIDANCVRVLQPFTVSAGVEAYPFSSFPQGANTLNVMSVNVQWGNLNYTMQRVSFRWLSAHTRSLIGWTQQPIVFAVYGENKLYFGPVPDQTYPVELDTAILPNALIDSTSVENIPLAWSSAVPYYAAYLAKQYQQMWQEAELFQRHYWQKLREVRAGAQSSIVGAIYTARR